MCALDLFRKQLSSSFNVSMGEEAHLTPEERDVCEDLKNAASVQDIKSLIVSKDVNYKSVDDNLYREKPSKTLIGLTLEAASHEWPENRQDVVELLKTQIEKGADFRRTLAVESKSPAPRNCLKILLEIIFSDCIASKPEPSAGNNKNLRLEEIAAKATENPRFLLAINGLYYHYGYKRIQAESAPAGPSDHYKTLEVKRKELHLHKIEADPFFRCLKWLLETSALSRDDEGTHRSSPYHGKIVKVNKDEYEVTPDLEELNAQTDDIILGTLQLVSDIKDEIPATESYLRTEYQKLADQTEEFAVALIDEVQDERELSVVIKMEDKLNEEDGFEDRLASMRKGIEKLSLIQHAINLRCKAFVVSKNCQYLIKKLVFGESMWRFWDDPRIMIGTGIPALLILALKIFLSSLCALSMTLLVPVYAGLSSINLCSKNKRFGKFIELYECPCQKFLLEVWWFIAFLCLVIITSCEKNFIQKLPSGLTPADDLVFAFVIAFGLRRLTSFLTRVQTLYTIPRYRRNWRLILPDLLTVLECASLLCFITAFSLWINRWRQLNRWQPTDDDYQTVDIFYSLGSLLCFFKLAQYLKAQHTLGTLNLSLYMMITEDIIYFAIIFVILLYVPFATAVYKMYSYYVVDNLKNATQPLASYKRTYDDLFWIILGVDVKGDSEISDSSYVYIKILGKAYIIVFAVTAVVVAFNMLVATLNHTHENVMRNVDKEYVFSRTRMWMEYIAKDHSVLPPPLNLTDLMCFVKCYHTMLRKEKTKEEYSVIKKKRIERISIIKRLVFLYLRRVLVPDNSEDYHDILTQSSAIGEIDFATTQV